MTDWKALCAELVNELHGYASANPYHDSDALITRARAALAAEADGPASVVGEPSDEELLDIAGQSIEPYDKIRPGEYEPENNCAIEVYSSELIAFARAVLARYGHQPAPPAEGEVAELVRWLRSRAGIPASPDFPAVAAMLTRAANLLEQRHPTPVPVSERLPGPEDCDGRDPECVKRWPDCFDGGYDPSCCRFPKSCSCGPRAQPEPEAVGPTDEELLELTEDWPATTGPRHDLSGCPEVPLYSVFADEVVEFARAVLSRYGHQPVPVAEGEVGELVADLRMMASQAAEACQFTDAENLSRAADLLEQRHPAPVPVASDTYFEFVISDADYCTQAEGSAPTYAQALSEGQHYLAQYLQDGPHTLELRRVEVQHLGAFPVPDDAPVPLPDDAQVIEPTEHTLLGPVPVPVPVSERLPGHVEQALIKAECALSDIAEGEPEEENEGDSAALLSWAEQRATAVLAHIRPVMREHGIRTSEWPFLPATALLEQRHPAPVPVAERLPGPEDCLDEGWAWFFSPRVGWRQAVLPVSPAFTHWLPATALPLPQGEVQT